MDNKLDGRVLLAVVLAVATLLIWHFAFAPKPTLPPPEASSSASAPLRDGGSASSGPASGPSAVVDEKLPPEQLFPLEGKGFSAQISSYDGVIKSWKILNHQYDVDGQPLDLIPEAPAGTRPYPGRLVFENSGFAVPPRMAFTKVSEPGDPAGSLRLRWVSGDQALTIDKLFTHDAQGDGLRLDVFLKNSGPRDLVAKLSLAVDGYQDPEKTTGKGFFIFKSPVDLASPACYANGELNVIPFNKKDDSKSITGEVAWAGINRNYFLKAFYPLEEPNPAALSCSISTQAQGQELTTLSYVTDTIPRGGQVKHSLGLYFGPKQPEEMAAKGAHLEGSINYGSWFGWLFGPIAGVMLAVMRFFYGVVGNWGIAIILLTLVVRLLTFYPAQKSFKSMQGMAALKPELDKLKEKYGDDQQRFAQEQMALMRAHGVSPFGGCLPLLLQMPFFFALYRMLYQSVEIYRADFGLWIHDLSAPDPFYVLPILLGIIMFVQQKLTPTTMDAAQARLMNWMMPAMMGLFMLFLPAGLVLYTFTSMLFGIGQQYLMRRMYPKPAAAAPAVTIERPRGPTSTTTSGPSRGPSGSGKKKKR